MTADAIDENDIKIIREASKAQAAAAKGTPRGSVQQRRNAERRATTKAVAANDGRRLRATGRTEPVGLRVTPEIKELLTQISQAEGMTVASIIEEAVLLYSDHLQSKAE